MRIKLSDKAREELRWYVVSWLTHIFDQTNELDIKFMGIWIDLLNGKVDLRHYETFKDMTSARGLDMIVSNLGVPLNLRQADNFYVENRVNVFAQEVKEQVEENLLDSVVHI